MPYEVLADSWSTPAHPTLDRGILLSVWERRSHTGGGKGRCRGPSRLGPGGLALGRWQRHSICPPFGQQKGCLLSLALDHQDTQHRVQHRCHIHTEMSAPAARATGKHTEKRDVPVSDGLGAQVQERQKCSERF